MTPKVIGILILLIAAGVESFAQTFLKMGASGGPRILAMPYKEWAHRYRFSSSAKWWIVLGVVFYAIQILLWTIVLHFLDVSIAFPMDSLCFVGVALLSMVFLGESVGRTRWLGVFCILSGAVLLAM